jgi:glycosyltransferase involved in cell wall biosynthesis
MKAVWSTPHAYRSAARLGAHHLSARLAARGWDVLFLSNPVSPFHVLNWRSHDTQLRLSQAMRGLECERDGLRTLLPMTLLPLAGRLGAHSRWVLDRWPAFTLPDLVRTLRRAGFEEPDLMVIDGPIGAPLIEFLAPRRSALRLLDRLAGFASTTPAMLGAMERAAGRVDLVAYSAEDLADDAAALKPRRSLHLANGADVAHFAEPRARPVCYAAIPEPRAVYVGTMAEWFDFELVALAARQRPKISFVLIGPPELARRRLPQLPNLHIIGSRPWDELPGYLQHAAIGLIPFDIENHRDLVRGVNPLKLYEYAACGLPVVSMAWPELRRLGAPIALADGPDDFIAALDRMLTSPPPPEVLKTFAAQHDWGAALDRLLASLGLADGGEIHRTAPSGQVRDAAQTRPG